MTDDAWTAAAGDPAALLALEQADLRAALAEAGSRLAAGTDRDRLAAAVEIEQAARLGSDVGALTATLAAALADPLGEVRAAAAAALSTAAGGRSTALDLAPVLTAIAGGCADAAAPVREHCVAALREAVRRGLDVAPALPALIDRLGDEASAVRQGAAFALRLAAEKGIDVGPAVPGLAALLSRPGRDARVMAIRALVRAARAGALLDPALDALAQGADDRDQDVAAAARDALAAWAKGGADRGGLVEAARARLTQSAPGRDPERLAALARLLRPDASGLVGFGPREVAAAVAFQEAAVAGLDLSRYLDDLHRSAVASTQVPVSQPLVNALAVHWLRAGRPEELRGLPFEFLTQEALRFAKEHGAGAAK